MLPCFVLSRSHRCNHVYTTCTCTCIDCGCGSCQCTLTSVTCRASLWPWPMCLAWEEYLCSTAASSAAWPSASLAWVGGWVGGCVCVCGGGGGCCVCVWWGGQKGRTVTIVRVLLNAKAQIKNHMYWVHVHIIITCTL